MIFLCIAESANKNYEAKETQKLELIFKIAPDICSCERNSARATHVEMFQTSLLVWGSSWKFVRKLRQSLCHTRESKRKSPNALEKENLKIANCDITFKSMNPILSPVSILQLIDNCLSNCRSFKIKYKVVSVERLEKVSR